MNAKLLMFPEQDTVREYLPLIQRIGPPSFPEKDRGDLSEKSITARASAITTILEDILSKGQAFPHGGINE